MSEKRNTILIADDFLINRQLLKNIFQEQYEILEAENGKEAITLLTRYQNDIALVFLDLLMPVKSGIEVLQFMEEEGLDKSIPVIVITGEATDESDERVYELGASDIIYKPFAPKVVMRRAKNIIELYEHRISLEEKLEQRTLEVTSSKKKLERFNEFLVNSLSTIAEFRTFDSDEHIERLKYFTRVILNYVSKQYPKYRLTKEQIELIVQASALHDIGKIAISDSILLKPDKLTEEEFEQVIKTNLNGTFFLSKTVAKYMIQNGIKGNILNIASSSSLRPAASAYTFSKWGIRGFTLGLAKTLAPYGITVNGLAPGPTATPMLHRDGHDITFEKNPMGRFAMPEEIANMAAVLVSDIGRMIVGDIVYMTGGAGVITYDDIEYKI